MEVPRVSTDVRIEVTGVIAHVEVRQRFRNPSELWAGAVYAFPLPENAVVDHLRTEMNQRVLSEVRRKVDAQLLYEQTLGPKQNLGAASQQPLLLRAPLADIAPHAAVDVTIGYLQIIDHHTARHSLRVPLATNRHRLSDLDARQGSPDAQPPPLSFIRFSQIHENEPHQHFNQAHQISVRISIDAGVRVTGITSPHHLISVTGADRVVVTSNSTNASPEHDFELAWVPEVGKARQLSLAKFDAAGEPTQRSFTQQPVSLRHHWAPLSDSFDESPAGSDGRVGGASPQTRISVIGTTATVLGAASSALLLSVIWMMRDWRRWKIAK